MVPSTFDMAEMLEQLDAVEQASRSVRSSWPSAVRGIQRISKPLLGRELLPRDDVGVVLELAEQDRVARAEVRRAP